MNQSANRDVPKLPPLPKELRIADVSVRGGETFYLLHRQITRDMGGGGCVGTDIRFEVYEIKEREMEKSTYRTELLKNWPGKRY